MNQEPHPLKNFLRPGGLKSTKERETILKELEILKDHFNAEKLYSVLNRKGAKVSRPTIYRTLKLLERLGLIDRLDIKKNCFYYEPMYQRKDHGHLICEQCGKIIDFSWRSIENLKSEVCKEKDFEPDKISIHVFGICEACQRASKSQPKIFEIPPPLSPLGRGRR
jgi:Fur family ferric uptake transcriptional regulator